MPPYFETDIIIYRNVYAVSMVNHLKILNPTIAGVLFMEKVNMKHSPIETTQWWTVLFEGIIALVIGLLFLAAPVSTLIAAAMFLGAYWFVIGVITLFSLVIDRTNRNWKLVSGILGIIAGIAIFEYPLLSAIVIPGTLIIYVAILGIIIGLISLYMAFITRSRRNVVTGIVSILFGLLIIIYPLSAILALTYALGAIGVIGGIVAIAFALNVRSKRVHFEAQPASGVQLSMGTGNELGKSGKQL
jgi:uncharacterized membrane protein HdeD (DUF308 family)